MMFLVFALGAAVGSFLNVLIDRVPKGEDIIWKPSHCDYCKKPLRWFELIPLLSFLFQWGRCCRCKKRLSWQYPIVELVTAIGFLLLYPHGIFFILFCAMFVIFVIDWKHMVIPDSMLLVCAVSALFLGLSVHKVVSAVTAGSGFWVLWRVTRGRGLGFGDVKLAGVIGLLLGYPGILIALYTAFLTGAFWGVILIMTKHARMKSRIAFGPFLIVGLLMAFLRGDAVWMWWLTTV